ncbi:unnamed protein product [Nesidiocoris tenuis]|uniref:Uncharacterized protein n=1 Tax=Nesidiocoris tenuis TaxID=355587 RepID=A0A6H5G6Z4_9HEMI|nr:unnamed protein product [Nesidiocoris tenuis]
MSISKNSRKFLLHASIVSPTGFMWGKNEPKKVNNRLISRCNTESILATSITQIDSATAGDPEREQNKTVLDPSSPSVALSSTLAIFRSPEQRK